MRVADYRKLDSNYINCWLLASLKRILGRDKGKPTANGKKLKAANMPHTHFFIIKTCQLLFREKPRQSQEVMSCLPRIAI
ncbi:MAG: hypothetical protein ACI8P3_001615 [Saprospiraceae bacterium]|jgi:hypothetical protein